MRIVRISKRTNIIIIYSGSEGDALRLIFIYLLIRRLLSLSQRQGLRNRELIHERFSTRTIYIRVIKIVIDIQRRSVAGRLIDN